MMVFYPQKTFQVVQQLQSYAKWMVWGVRYFEMWLRISNSRASMCQEAQVWLRLLYVFASSHIDLDEENSFEIFCRFNVILCVYELVPVHVHYLYRYFENCAHKQKFEFFNSKFKTHAWSVKYFILTSYYFICKSLYVTLHRLLP